ncbi:hypothetical protein HDU76_013100 [Blyttiomyces sp. JEL0837]|nr:hypothetical protein HDU76_013100 [Blyttiomyces sp. JEL0837]
MFRRYVAKYVRKSSVFEEVGELANSPRRYGSNGVSTPVRLDQEPGFVVMIDISAYSKLSGILAQRYGKLSSEIMVDTLGKYLSQIIDLIDTAKGDVIKFLGDAIFVRFSVADIAKGSPSAGYESTNEIPPFAVKHVMDCCLDILSLYHDYSVNFGNSATSQRASVATGNGHVPAQKVDYRDLDGYKLSLHIAMNAGVLDNVILGYPDQRLDYSVAGPVVTEIGRILNAAGPGELALPKSLWDSMSQTFPLFLRGKVTEKDTVTIISKLGESQSFTPGYTLPTRGGRRSSLVPLPSSVVNRLSTVTDMDVNEISLEAQTVYQKFINSSLVYKIATNQPTSGKSMEDFTAEDLPEYRRMTVMFIKLKFPFEAPKAQRCMEICIDTLSKYDGVLQQFSVDDKGITILSIFGLPPYSHERECDFSVSCAVDLEMALKAEKLQPFSISLSTGDVLFSVIGNARRSEAGLMSDVIVVAARLMELEAAQNCVVCDDNTKNALERTFAEALVNVGMFPLKGRTEPVMVWKASKPNMTKRNRTGQDYDKPVNLIGYEQERNAISDKIEVWRSPLQFDGFTFIIEGPGGMGKSYLASYFLQYCRSKQIQTWQPPITFFKAS